MKFSIFSAEKIHVGKFSFRQVFVMSNSSATLTTENLHIHVVFSQTIYSLFLQLYLKISYKYSYTFAFLNLSFITVVYLIPKVSFYFMYHDIINEYYKV